MSYAIKAKHIRIDEHMIRSIQVRPEEYLIHTPRHVWETCIRGVILNTPCSFDTTADANNKFSGISDDPVVC